MPLVTFRVELPTPLEPRMMLVGLRFVMGPDGEIEADSVTVPE